MVLNNIAIDCELLTDFFKRLSYFTDLLEIYKKGFETSYNNAILKLSGITISEEQNYVDIIYDLAEDMCHYSWNISTTIQKFLVSSQFHSDTLNEQLKLFSGCIKQFIVYCDTSSSYKNTPNHYSYASELYTKFEKVYSYYITLYSNISFFKSIIAELYNEVPEQIQNNSNYIELTIQSNKETSDLQTMSKDIELISNIIINIQALFPEDVPKDYHIQKVESGSIFISILVAAPLFKQIIATIDYCATIYYKHRNNHINLKKEQIALEKEQNILGLLKKYQEQGLVLEDNGQTLEQLERIIATTDKYIDSNPSVKLNNVEYNTQTQTTSLTDRILLNISNDEPEVPINDN